MFQRSDSENFRLILLLAVSLSWGCSAGSTSPNFTRVTSIATAEFGEPFGIAVRDGEIFVSDGEAGKVSVISAKGVVDEPGFDTPSGIAFGPDGHLIVADSGKNAIYRLDPSPTKIAGIEHQRGFADGDGSIAMFNGPTGIAVGSGGKIYVSDSYNDRIRVIENGMVSTLAGGAQGFADGHGAAAQFDTPLGLAMWGERLLVADAGNRRVRVVEPDGRVWTLAGNGGGDLADGLPMLASFVRPTAIAVSADGVIYVADGNTIRAIGRRSLPYVETISSGRRGFRDGVPSVSQFNRPSGLAIDGNGRLLVADSDNGLIRAFETVPTPQKKEGVMATTAPTPTPMPRQFTAEEFRSLQPQRWPYDPADRKRDVAGTLGEIRGEIVDENSQVWFHNGLDIAGGYGETARFVRTEKVLNPISTENFGDLRELIRMPTLGYIHIRLGRDANDKPFGDQRFIFSNLNGMLNGIRIPRGAKFNAGDAIGTLNAMNHVHLIAGRQGSEMNALNALTLPNVSDSIAPVIEKVSIFDESWNEIETPNGKSRINLTGKTRVVVRAFDRMDGNPERRKLGVYKLGYQIINGSAGEIDWTISFDRNPPFDAVKTVYARGSKSGATGETIFNYIVTNRMNTDGFGEGFIDAATLENGTYTLRVFAADLFGNQTSKDIQFEVNR